MNETRKSRAHREARGDFDKYLRGTDIDIGAGADPLVVKDGTVQAWDQGDGDAQLMEGVLDESFDFVYSSHCLEQLRSVPEALKNWIRILKPGGYLYFVVPDYLLYEKMCWPSMQPQHLQSFSFLIPNKAVGRPNHYHINLEMKPLLAPLGVEMLVFYVEDLNFNYNDGLTDQTRAGALAQLCVIGRKSSRARRRRKPGRLRPVQRAPRRSCYASPVLRVSRPRSASRTSTNRIRQRLGVGVVHSDLGDLPRQAVTVAHQDGWLKSKT